MEGADRIRPCALNYFIEPARDPSLIQMLKFAQHGLTAEAFRLRYLFDVLCPKFGSAA